MRKAGAARRSRKIRSDQARGVAEHFGLNLRRVRRREGLSQEQLAVRASLHRTAIGLLENGQRVPRADTLIQLAGAMAVPSAELLLGIEWIPGPPMTGTYSFSYGWDSAK